MTFTRACVAKQIVPKQPAASKRRLQFVLGFFIPEAVLDVYNAIAVDWPLFDRTGASDDAS
jgi:hypothetical protein